MDPSRIRSDPERSLVGFHVGEGYYAVEVPAVREIIAPAHLVMVPSTAPIVSGVTDHRGRVVPVVDLRRRFSLPVATTTRRTKWIVVEARGGQWLGLVVDDVTEVFGVSSAHEREAPRLGNDDVARGFTRVYAVDGELVLVLDLDLLAAAVEQGAGGIVPPSWKPRGGGSAALGAGSASARRSSRASSARSEPARDEDGGEP
jgi:purine-binding chemotaxis protein CheW